MSQYTYYGKKPKSEIAKDIFTWIAIGGSVIVAANSPYFSTNLLRAFQKRKRYDKKKVYDTFTRLRREGYLEIKEYNHQLYISLTEEGKKKAGRFQIDSLQVKKPRHWDKKWRIVLFDIENKKNIKRNALRGKLKELGFYLYQKSVWVHPYNCNDEIALLKNFFGLADEEISLIVAEKIAKEKEIREFFKL